MKVMIFGTGRYYERRKEQITPETEIVAYVDNNMELCGQYINGIPIILPCEISGILYDQIILMSAKADEMKTQLLEIGIPEEAIWYWEQYLSETVKGTFRFFGGNVKPLTDEKKVLIISTDLNYNGGTIAAVYAAKALRSRGYFTVLAARDGNQKFIDETVREGIDIVLCPAFPYLHPEELCWIRQFDAVIVNVFQMIRCASEISRIKPVIWWIHEPSADSESIYPDVLSRFRQYAQKDKMKEIDIYAVSGIAKRNFNGYFPDRIRETLAYGIPDQGAEELQIIPHEKKVFAVIGGICSRKAQDIFIQAVTFLNEAEKENAEFWLAGSIGEDEYSLRIRELTQSEPVIKILGLLTRNEMDEIYQNIDVVVCSSLEDPLPIVLTEGMMYGKICIVSDAVGTADYIVDQENGLICRTGDAKDLSEKMRWVMKHEEKANLMRKEARKTYEKYFTMDKFAERLECVVSKSIDRRRKES